MASAILRAAGPLRHRVPLLLSSSARSTPRGLEEERQFLARRAGLPAGEARLLSSCAARRPSPCKFNRGRKGPVGIEDQLESIKKAVNKDVRSWRELRDGFEQNEMKRAELYKRQDRVVAYASAAVALALVAANVMRSD